MVNRDYPGLRIKVVEKRGSEDQLPPESVITFDRNARPNSPPPPWRSSMPRYTRPASVRKAVSRIQIAMNSAQEKSDRPIIASSACLFGKGLSDTAAGGHIRHDMFSTPVANHIAFTGPFAPCCRQIYNGFGENNAKILGARWPYVN